MGKDVSCLIILLSIEFYFFLRINPHPIKNLFLHQKVDNHVLYFYTWHLFTPKAKSHKYFLGPEL
jgi:hypothetical protein